MYYEFLIAGRVSDTVQAAFPELEVAADPGPRSMMFGSVRDRAALHGLLARFDDLGLTVVEMRQLPTRSPSARLDAERDREL